MDVATEYRIQACLVLCIIAAMSLLLCNTHPLLVISVVCGRIVVTAVGMLLKKKSEPSRRWLCGCNSCWSFMHVVMRVVVHVYWLSSQWLQRYRTPILI